MPIGRIFRVSGQVEDINLNVECTSDIDINDIADPQREYQMLGMAGFYNILLDEKGEEESTILKTHTQNDLLNEKQMLQYAPTKMLPYNLAVEKELGLQVRGDALMLRITMSPCGADTLILDLSKK